MINLKILFENITKYDKEIYTDFLKFHQKIFGFKYSLYTAFVIGMLLILVTIQIQIHNLDIAIIICFVITIFILLRYLRPASRISKEFNSKTIHNKEECTLTFYEKNFKVSENNKLENYIIKYSSLYKVFETSNFFYLYTDKTHSLLVNKNNFTIGNSEDFSRFIHTKYKFRFRKFKKIK